MKIAQALAMLCLGVTALQACNQPAAPATQAETALTGDTNKPDSAAPPAEGVPRRDMLLGRWGDNGDCTHAVVFNADGTFSMANGGAGTWTLAGDRVAMTGAEGTFEVRVAVINANTMMIGNADGSYGMSQRC